MRARVRLRHSKPLTNLVYNTTEKKREKEKLHILVMVNAKAIKLKTF